MTKPTTNNPTSLAPETAQQGRTPGHKLKVTLVVEHGPNLWDASNISELATLFSPESVELSVIHVNCNLLLGLPKQQVEADQFNLWLTESLRHQDESKEQLDRHMQKAGFTIQQELGFTQDSESLQAIVKFIENSGQELLILCGNNHQQGTPMGRNHFLTNLTSHTPITTLLLRRKFSHKTPVLRALFGVDPSDASLNAARKLAQIFQPDKLALTLATVQSPAYQENAVLAPYVNQQILDEALESNAGMVFEMFTDILRPLGFRIEDMKVLIGSAATELGYTAETEHPDLVVVGSHNHKGFLAWVMGSVSSQLLHWDTHNLLVVR